MKTRRESANPIRERCLPGIRRMCPMFPDNDRIMKPMTSDRRFEYRHDCLCNAASSIKAEAVMLKRSLSYRANIQGSRTRRYCSGRKGKKRPDEEPEERTTTNKTAEYPR